MRKVALVVITLFACGGSPKAVPTEVEIEWPDAALQYSSPPVSVDAGIENDAVMSSADAKANP